MPAAPSRNPKTTRRRIDVAERRRRLLEYRRAGLTYQEILDHHPDLGYKTTAAAAQDATRALEVLVAEPAREVLALELSRLDALTQSLWKAARSGDGRAVDRVLRVMERRAKYLGLDHEHRTDDAGADDTKSMLQSLSDQLAAAAADLPDLGEDGGL